MTDISGARCITPRDTVLNTETRELSGCQLCGHRWHWRLLTCGATSDKKVGMTRDNCRVSMKVASSSKGWSKRKKNLHCLLTGVNSFLCNFVEVVSITSAIRSLQIYPRAGVWVAPVRLVPYRYLERSWKLFLHCNGAVGALWLHDITSSLYVIQKYRDTSFELQRD